MNEQTTNQDQATTDLTPYAKYILAMISNKRLRVEIMVRFIAPVGVSGGMDAKTVVLTALELVEATDALIDENGNLIQPAPDAELQDSSDASPETGDSEV